MPLVSFGFCQDSYASVLRPLFPLVYYQCADHVDIDIVFIISPAALYTRTRRRGSKVSGAVSSITLLSAFGSIVAGVTCGPVDARTNISSLINIHGVVNETKGSLVS